MSLHMKQTTIWFFDQVLHKPVYTATQNSKNFEILDLRLEQGLYNLWAENKSAQILHS